MKTFLSILIGLVMLSFAGAALYVFELPPFQPRESQKKSANEAKTDQTTPEKTKIARTKTYNEYINRAKQLEKNGYPLLAVAEYENARKLNQSEIEPIIEIGRIHLENKDYLKAKINFKEVLDIDTENIEAKIYLGKTQLGDGKIPEARQVFDSIKNPDQKTKYYQALVAGYFGEYEKSRNLLKEAENMNTDEKITSKIKIFLSAYNEWDLYQEGKKIHLKTLLGRSYNEIGEYHLAKSILIDVVLEKKDYRDARILLGYAYLKLEKYQDAIETFEDAKKLDPEKAETFFFLGLSYYGMENLPKTIENLEIAKKTGFQPQVQIEQKLAEVYLELKEYNKSVQNFENVLSYNSENVKYFIRPVSLYLEHLNQPEKAMILAQKAVDKHPNEALSYNLFAWAALQANKLPEAEKNLKKAIKLNPNLDAIYLNFGILNEKKGQYSQALIYFKKAHELSEGSPIGSIAVQHYNNLIGKMDELDYATLKVNTLNP